MISVSYGKCKKCGKKCNVEFMTSRDAIIFLNKLDTKDRLCIQCRNKLDSAVFVAKEVASKEFMEG